METSEFSIYFKRVPYLSKHFSGTFPIDKIPDKIKKKTFFVCNLDPSFLNGSHWICFIRLSSDEIEIFDSLGFRPELVFPYLKFQKPFNIIFNTSPVQSKTSNQCGKFVITFIVERMLNQTMFFNDLVEEVFSKDLNKNDVIVNEFCNELTL